ncbi:MAG TPA: hypothetical protein EYP59_14655 [Thiotrichaceae bacterium]|nr:hypothetical protein [Thiotrichaceae bacterium]
MIDEEHHHIIQNFKPQELCWGVVKNHIARHCDFTLSNLREQLEEGFSKVDASTCVKVIRKIREKENQFFHYDMLFDPSE